MATNDARPCGAVTLVHSDNLYEVINIIVPHRIKICIMTAKSTLVPDEQPPHYIGFRTSSDGAERP